MRCAEAIIDALGAIDVEIHAGVHTGVIERMGDNVGGLAVHVGARVVAHANASEILVSSTVKDLTAGSGITYQSIGEREPKGCPSPGSCTASSRRADPSSAGRTGLRVGIGLSEATGRWRRGSRSVRPKLPQ